MIKSRSCFMSTQKKHLEYHKIHNKVFYMGSKDAKRTCYPIMNYIFPNFRHWKAPPVNQKNTEDKNTKFAIERRMVIRTEKVIYRDDTLPNILEKFLLPNSQ